MPDFSLDVFATASVRWGAAILFLLVLTTIAIAKRAFEASNLEIYDLKLAAKRLIAPIANGMNAILSSPRGSPQVYSISFWALLNGLVVIVDHHQRAYKT